MNRRFGVVIVIALLSISCGSDGGADDVVLVSRLPQTVGDFVCDDAGSICRTRVDDFALRSATGEHAVLLGRDASWNLDFVTDVEIRCAGVGDGSQGTELPEVAERNRPADSGASVQELVFGDGSLVQLFPDVDLNLWLVENFFTCYEESGSWQGVSGSFMGRGGRYRFTQDSLQNTLVLSAG
jgi:hypothetical protein